MKIRLIVIFLGAVASSFGSAATVISPQARAEILAQARQLLASRAVPAPEALNNPFNSEAFALASGNANLGGSQPAAGGPQARPAGPRAARELVATVAEGLRPTGFFVVSGEPTLVFGQKRVKAGDNLTITFEGAEYTIVITTITPPNFTFRLGSEEFTRPIR